MLDMNRISMLNKFSEQKSDSDAKFNVLKNQNNELKNEIQELNKCLENNNEIIRTNLNKLEQSVERMGVHVMSINKSKTNENCNDKCKNMLPEKELIKDNNNVENNENNNIEYSNVFEELVSETDTVKIKNESTDELVECLSLIHIFLLHPQCLNQ